MEGAGIVSPYLKNKLPIYIFLYVLVTERCTGSNPEENRRAQRCGLLRARISSPTVEVSVFEAYIAVSGNSNRSLSQLAAMKNVTFPKDDCQLRHSEEDSVH